MQTKQGNAVKHSMKSMPAHLCNGRLLVVVLHVNHISSEGRSCCVWSACWGKLKKSRGRTGLRWNRTSKRNNLKPFSVLRLARASQAEHSFKTESQSLRTLASIHFLSGLTEIYYDSLWLDTTLQGECKANQLFLTPLQTVPIPI